MRRAIGFSLLMLSACVAPSRPEPKPEPAPPAPVPTPTPSPVPQGEEWRDWPLTPGDWSYARATTTAEYGRAGSAPLLVLRCDRASPRVRMIWATPAAAGPLTIRTTYGDTVRAAVRSASGLEADIAARDPLLDQMAFSRGRFMLLAGGQALIVPAWPEVSRVIEDCR